jgi:hypothetical protein
MALDILKDVNNFKNFETIVLDNTINFSKYSELLIFSMNIRNIKLHKDELAIYLDSINVKFDVIILSETWLGYDFKYILNGYQTINSISKFNKCDGITIFVKENIKLLGTNDNVLCNSNSLELIVECCGTIYNIIGVYRSPSSDIGTFLNTLESYLNNINTSNKIVICGDINNDILSNSLYATEYLNLMLIDGFISCINNYTRVFKDSKSCLDHIFSKNISIDNILSYIVKLNITDNFPTMIFFTSNPNLNNNKEPEKSDTKNVINIDHLNMLIRTENWDLTLQNI